MAAPDLITLSRATTNIPSYTSAASTTVSTLITAASRAIEKYCRRDFAQHTYDELYNGDGDRRLILRQYPLLSVQSVRYRPVTVIKITNNGNSGATVIARAEVTSTGITLTWATNGVYSTNTSCTFSGNNTITSLIAAINAVGSGWVAQDTGYGIWPAADIYCPNGLGVSDPMAPLAATQGALNAAPGILAEIKLHTYELGGFQLDPRRGWLLRAIPYTDPELIHPEDLIWPVGINNFRIQYTAGFATVPEDVQEACAELVASWYQQLGRDLTLRSEDTARTYSYVTENEHLIPSRVRALLLPYRSHRVYSPMS
jgi:hypothetical protein